MMFARTCGARFWASLNFTRVFWISSRMARIVAIAPLAGNELALGFDLRSHSDPMVRARLHRVETTDRIAVNGPINLRQGGRGIVIQRRFRRPGFAGHDLAALVQDLDPLLDEAGLLRPPGLRVALEDGSGHFISGDSTVAAEDPVDVLVRIPDEPWHLLAVPPLGWTAAIRLRLFLFAAGVFISGLLIVLVVYLLFGRV